MGPASELVLCSRWVPRDTVSARQQGEAISEIAEMKASGLSGLEASACIVREQLFVPSLPLSSGTIGHLVSKNRSVCSTRSGSLGRISRGWNVYNS